MSGIRDAVWVAVYAREYARQYEQEVVKEGRGYRLAEWRDESAALANTAVECMPCPDHVSPRDQ